jgi:hypothetical protein
MKRSTAWGRGHGAQGRVSGAQGMVRALLFSWRSLREIFSENQFFVPQRSTKEAQKNTKGCGLCEKSHNEIYVTKFTLRILRNYSSRILLLKTIDNA